MPLPVIPSDGLVGFQEMVQWFLRQVGNAAYVKLFQNDYTPDGTTLVSSFVEADFVGYAPIFLPNATDQGTTGTTDTWLYLPLTWTCSSGGTPNTIYGYWLQFLSPFGAHPTRVPWCQRFDTPQAITAAGQTVSFVLSLTDTQGT